MTKRILAAGYNHHELRKMQTCISIPEAAWDYAEPPDELDHLTTNNHYPYIFCTADVLGYVAYISVLRKIYATPIIIGSMTCDEILIMLERYAFSVSSSCGWIKTGPIHIELAHPCNSFHLFL